MNLKLDLPAELAQLILTQEENKLKTKGKLIHIYGEAGTGKTTLALQLATSFCKNNHKVFFLDTEGKVSGTKLRNIVGKLHFQQVNTNFKLIQLRNFSEQQKFIEKLDLFFLTQHADLVIIDTITNHYRQSMLFQKDAKKLYEQLAYQVAYLGKLAREKEIIIILFNQATMRKKNKTENDFDVTEKIDPVARAIMGFWTTKEIILLKKGWGNFEARIPGDIKKRVEFTIGSDGIITKAK